MNSSKRKKLEAAGWKTGSVAEFLGLSDEEAVLVEMKIAIAARIKELRERRAITQQQFAKQIGSSQSRVAKIEAADPSVSLDLLVRSLASLGASRKEIGSLMTGSPSRIGSRTGRPKQNDRVKAKL